MSGTSLYQVTMIVTIPGGPRSRQGQDERFNHVLFVVAENGDESQRKAQQHVETVMSFEDSWTEEDSEGKKIEKSESRRYRFGGIEEIVKVSAIDVC